MTRSVRPPAIVSATWGAYRTRVLATAPSLQPGTERHRPTANFSTPTPRSGGSLFLVASAIAAWIRVAYPSKGSSRALARSLGLIAGSALCLIGAVGTYDFLVPSEERIVAAWLGLSSYIFVAPALVGVGLLVCWMTWLWSLRASSSQLKLHGISMGLLGLGLLVVPPVIGYMVDASRHAEGSFFALTAFIVFGEPGLCLLLCSLVLLGVSGQLS